MGWAPDSCTLPTAQRPLREAEFDALLARAVAPPRRDGATRLLLRLPAADAATARDLAARESSCCTFFVFAVTVEGDETVLDVRVPLRHTGVLDAVEARAAARSEEPSTG